jgi:WD40 repeat protein
MYWDLQSGQSKTIATNPTRIRAICASKDGKYVYGGTDDGLLMQWSIDNGESKVILDNKNSIYAIAMNSSGSRVVIGDKNGNIIIVNLTTGKVSSRIQGHSARVLDISYSPDNSQIASSSFDGTVKIWSTQDMSETPITITEQESWVMALIFTPDGRRVITSSNNADLLFYWMTRSDYMADQMCKYITRNLSKSEWNNYIGEDIEYEKTCLDK